MGYKVVKAFTDLQDNNYVYNAGDSFPRNGYKPSKERVKELASKDNKRNTVLIEKEPTVEQPKIASDEEVEKAIDELHEKKGNKRKEK